MYNQLYIAKVIYDTDRLKPNIQRPYGRVYIKILGLDPGNSNFQASQGSNNPNTMSPQELEVIGKTFPADVMQPIFSGGTSTTYNANKNLIGVQDSGSIEDQAATPPAESFYGIGDEYVGGPSSISAGVNPNAYAYSPDNRSNSFKGMISYPRKDATVVVSFLHGLRGNPIILGYYLGATNLDSISDVGNGIYPDVPFAYSNLTESSEDGN